MNCIQIHLLYRDAGNYKQAFSRIYSNPDQHSPREIEEKIKPHLIEDLYLPHSLFHFESEFAYDDELDHDWCEWDGVEVVDAISERSLSELFDKLAGS